MNNRSFFTSYPLFVSVLQKEFINTVSHLDELATTLKAKGVKLEAV